MANKGNTRTQSFENMQSEYNRKDDMNNRGREPQSIGRSGSSNNNNNEFEQEIESRSRSSRSRSSRSRKRSRSPLLNESKGGPDICRDYLRNECTRGDDCRYFHPHKGDKFDRGDRSERADRSPRFERSPKADRVDRDSFRKKSWFTVCLDYQNGKCSRDDCRYFHVSDDDEDLYRETGEVSNHILNQAVCNVHLDIPSDRMRPTCKDYLNGSCKLKNCRYRHVSREEYEDEIYKYLQDALYEIIGPPRGGLGRNLPQHKPGLLGPAPFQQPRDMKENYGRPGSLLNEFRPEIFDRRDDEPRQLMDMRGNSYHMRTENFRDSRDIDLNDIESLRSECIRLQDCLYDGIREKDDIIAELEMKLSDFKRSFMESEDYDDQSIMAKLNRELQMEIDSLHRENAQYKNDRRSSSRSGADFEHFKSEARMQIAELEDDNQMLMEKTDKLETQITFFKNEIQVWKSYENFVKDQIANLQSQFFIAERELSHSWGGGPPPLASQREAWSRVKSIVSLVANTNPQNIPPNNTKLKLETDGKPTPPLANVPPGNSPGIDAGNRTPVSVNAPLNAQNMRPSVSNIRPNAPNSIRPTVPNVVRPGAPNTIRTNTPVIRPNAQNVRLGAPGVVRPMAPGMVRPVAPGSIRPIAPGMIRPVAPGSIRQMVPGPVRPVAPGSVRATVPGNIRSSAPNMIRPNAPNDVKTTTPNNLMPNAPNIMRPNAPNAIRPNQPGNVRPVSAGNIRPNQPNLTRPTQPNQIRPSIQNSNRPNIQTNSPSTTTVETTTYKSTEGYNTVGYYTSGTANYQANVSGNYSGYTSEVPGGYSATGSANYAAEAGNYSSTTPVGYPTNASGTYTADASAYSSGTAGTYPTSSTVTYPTNTSTTYSTGASGAYSAGVSGTYSTGTTATYPTNVSYPTAAAGTYATADGTYPTADASGSYPTNASYPTVDGSGYATTGNYTSSYPPGSYSADMYASYNESYSTYNNTDDKKNAEFISQMYNQPPPPPPSQGSPTPTPTSKAETSNTYWRTGF